MVGHPKRNDPATAEAHRAGSNGRVGCQDLHPPCAAILWPGSARWTRTYHGEPWRQVPARLSTKDRSEAAVVKTALVAGASLDRSFRWSSLPNQPKPSQRRALTNWCLPPQGEGRGEAIRWPGMVRTTGCPAPQRKLEGRRVTPDPEDDDGPQETEYAAAMPPLTGDCSLYKGSAGRKGRSHA